MNRKYTALVKCPFYIRERENTIVCEGEREGMEISIKFINELRKLEYQEEHCNKNVTGCPYERLARDKYKEDRDE